jgi:hypothetical protein
MKLTSSRRTTAVTVLFFDGILERFVVQRQLRVHLLEPGVLGLELLQAPQLRHIEPPVLRLPLVVSRRTDAVLASNLGHLHAGIGFSKDRDDFLFTESGLLHSSSPWGKLYS